MREIKFRGLSKKGEWIYGDLIQRTHKFIFPTGVYAYNIFEFLIEVDPETVGQYTGLKDKNGTEIYEGDLVDWNGLYEIRFGEHDVPSVEDEVVIDHATGFYFKAQHDLKDIEPFGFDIPMNKGYAEDCKIIGNIHEHPHLLEVDSNA